MVRARRLLWPALATLAMLVVLIGLGTWQVERLAWKERILAELDRAERAPAVPLPAAPISYQKIRVAGRWRPDLAALYGDEVRDGPRGAEMGAELIEPLIPVDGLPVLVDRGWVPQGWSLPPEAESGVVAGYARPASRSGWFSARDDPAARRFYTLDPAAIGAAFGLPRVANFVLVALGPETPGQYPAPASHLPRPRNAHLGYAVTWYGLALCLLVIFLAWSRKAFRA